MPTYTTEGIILKAKNLGEADRILTIFTRQQGKINAVAKGVRKVTSRKGGNTDVLNHSRFIIAVGKNLDIITEAEAITTFPHIKSRLKYTALAFKVAELVDKFFMESQENFRIFRGLIMTLGKIDSKELDLEEKYLVARQFEVRMLKEVGFDPELINCVSCGNSIALRRAFFSVRYGGITCGMCKKGGIKISSNGLNVMVNLQNRTWEDVRRTKPKITHLREIENVLDSYFEHILEKELKSRRLNVRVTTLA